LVFYQHNYILIDKFYEIRKSKGLSYEEAKNLAVSTMLGSAKMVEENPNKTLDELINAVCSKGGTTIQAVNSFNEDGLNEITKKAIDACVKRSVELENL
jgi:pyrroline-5-carboxylate reductase